jgi:hypothetical protein
MHSASGRVVSVFGFLRQEIEGLDRVKDLMQN